MKRKESEKKSNNSAHVSVKVRKNWIDKKRAIWIQQNAQKLLSTGKIPKLYRASSHQNLPDSCSRSAFESFVDGATNEGVVLEKYVVKTFEGLGVMSRQHVTPIGIQNIQRSVRHALVGAIQLDLDFKNCHPVILGALLKKRLHTECHQVLDFVENRDDWFSRFNKAFPNEKLPAEAKRGSAKSFFNALMNGGGEFQCLSSLSGKKTFKKIDLPRELDELRRQFKKARELLLACPLFIDVLTVAKIKMEEAGKTSNLSGSFLSCLLCHFEQKALAVAEEVLKREGFEMTANCHDGGTIRPKDDKYPFEKTCKHLFDKVLPLVDAAVLTETGIPLKMTVKKMNPDQLLPANWEQELKEVEELSIKEELALCVERNRAFHNQNPGPKKGSTNKEYSRLKEFHHSKIVDSINKHFCLLNGDSGKNCVIYQEPQQRWDEAAQRFWPSTLFVRKAPRDAIEAWNHYQVQLPNGSKIPILRFWLDQNGIRVRSSVEFEPDPKASRDKTHLNMYTGLCIGQDQAVEGDVSAFINHTREIIANGNEEIAEYLLNWVAHLVQKPGVKTKTAPVLIGGCGAGKSLWVSKFARVLGDSYFIHSTKPVTGEFQQAKSITNLLTFVDEASFGGDKREASVLKGLLTESTRQHNVKHVNPIEVANKSCYIFASNSWKPVFVEKDDRRFLVCDVNNRFAGPATEASKTYFQQLAGLDARAIAFFLYKRDIATFDPAVIPNNSPFMKAQRKSGLDSVELFCCEVAETGNLYVHDQEYVLGKTSQKIPFSDVYRLYREQKGGSFDHKVNESTFEMVLNKALGTTVGIYRPQTCDDRRPRIKMLVFPDWETTKQNWGNHVADPSWFQEFS